MFALATRRRALRVPIYWRELPDAVPERREGAELGRTGQMLALGGADGQRQVAILIAYSDVCASLSDPVSDGASGNAPTVVCGSVRLPEWSEDVLP